MDDNEKRFCQTSVADRVLDALEVAQRNNWIISIEGPPGVGKTTAAIAYRDRRKGRVWYYAVRPDTGREGPLFRDIVEHFVGFKSMQTRENVGSIRQEADRRFTEHDPLMLILDEAQNLNADTLEMLRSIHDDGILALAFIGNHTFTDRHNTERRTLAASPQFLSRLDKSIRLSPVPRDDVAMVARASGVPVPLIGQLASVAAGHKGMRIVAGVSAFAADLARSEGVTSPASKHFRIRDAGSNSQKLKGNHMPQAARSGHIVRHPRLLDPVAKSVPGLIFEPGEVVEADRARSDVARDIDSIDCTLEHVARIIDITADYALEPNGTRRTTSYCENIYALLSGAAALQRETMVRLLKIGAELQSGHYHDDDKE